MACDLTQHFLPSTYDGLGTFDEAHRRHGNLGQKVILEVILGQKFVYMGKDLVRNNKGVSSDTPPLQARPLYYYCYSS